MGLSELSTRIQRGQRYGLALPIILVCLLVVTLIGASMVQTVLLQRRWARQVEYEQQAAWLADAAIQRAQARLEGDDEYSGETWNVSSEEMQTGYAGTVVIRIASTDGTKRIQIEATYPVHPVRQILQRREKLVAPTSPGGSS